MSGKVELDVVLDQPLGALHDVRSEFYRAIVIYAGYLSFLGYRDNFGHIEECGDHRLGQGEDEYVCEHQSSEDIPWEAVWASCFASIHKLEDQEVVAVFFCIHPYPQQSDWS